MPGNIQSSLTNFAAVQKAILLRDANKEKDLLDKSNLTLAIDACTSSDTFLQNLLRLSQQIIKDEDSDLDTKKNQIKDIATRVNSQGKTALNLALEEQNFLAAAFLINNESSWNNKCEGAFATAMHTNSKTVNSYYGYYGSDNYRNANFGQGRFEHHIVKKYGLTLGVELTAKDGTTSQYGYTGPALEELTDKIKSHSATNEKFVEIYEANAATLSACNYYGSLPKNPNAAKILSAKIQATCSDSAQGVVNIPCGYAQHSLGVSVVDGYLVVTNRRNEPGSVPGTKIYKITEPSKYSPEIINTLIGGAGNSIPEEDVLKALYAGVNPVPVLEIRQKGQKHDNCTVANPKSSIAGVLFVQHAREYGGVEKVLKSTSLKDKVLKQSHEEYKIFTKELRVSTAM
ncbi:MAG: hypothetical protein HOI53_08180, partial [Francisellaceae bacterium]|nr:hypothetical protein [Francisellaceae bacterium]